MFSEDQQDLLFPSDGKSGEGWFDAQLSLPFPIPPAATPSQWVVKRNGHREPFSKQKITEAIAKAALAAGRPDPEFAESSAAAVSIYLAKHVNNDAPSADQISDAVERVLVLTAHPEVALTYARHRDRRMRIRRLREGDLRLLSGEMEEAWQEREARRVPDSIEVSMSSMGEGLRVQDLTGLLGSLTAEAELGPELGQEIGSTIERQIRDAGITHLSVPLARELLGAQLAERGLWAAKERLGRLGVSLQETARRIQGKTPETLGGNPKTTDLMLAKVVKREYALSEVFSGPVARAHLVGDIHLHGLSKVDRLYRAEHSAWHAFADPAYNVPAEDEMRLPECLLSFSDAMDAHFSEPMGWYAFNSLLAPRVRDLDESGLKRMCKHFLFELARRQQPEERRRSRLHLPWSVPSDLTAPEMGQGTDGNDFTASVYAAQQMLWVLLDIVKEIGTQGISLPVPFLDIEVDESVFDSLEGEHFMKHAASVAKQCPEIRFILRVPEGEEPGVAAPLGRPRNVIWHKVTLNLVRSALKAEQKADLYRSLDEMCSVAIESHVNKRDFIESLLGENRVLSKLARQHDGHEYANAERDKFAVGVDGLHECAGVFCGMSNDVLRERLGFMEDLLQWLRRRIYRAASSRNIRCCLEANSDPRVSARFATLDAQRFPRRVALVADNLSDPTILSYTPGVSLPASLNLTPLNAVTREGRLHALLDGVHYSRISLNHMEFSENALADFIRISLRRTRCGGLQLEP